MIVVPSGRRGFPKIGAQKMNAQVLIINILGNKYQDKEELFKEGPCVVAFECFE